MCTLLHSERCPKTQRREQVLAKRCPKRRWCEQALAKRCPKRQWRAQAPAMSTTEQGFAPVGSACRTGTPLPGTPLPGHTAVCNHVCRFADSAPVMRSSTSSYSCALGTRKCSVSRPNTLIQLLKAAAPDAQLEKLWEGA